MIESTAFHRGYIAGRKARRNPLVKVANPYVDVAKRISWEKGFNAGWEDESLRISSKRLLKRITPGGRELRPMKQHLPRLRR